MKEEALIAAIDAFAPLGVGDSRWQTGIVLLVLGALVVPLLGSACLIFDALHSLNSTCDPWRKPGTAPHPPRPSFNQGDRKP